MRPAGTPNIHASSTGQAQTGSAWLDAHFEVSRPEYEAQVRAVGIQPGWHVLDAGCGSGSFLPWLADLVGPTGQLAALDLAPDNIATVENRLASYRFGVSVETRVGSVLALPYPDHTFDAVWFANTSQYLTDADLATALAEMRRVVRPGGLVALKETDASLNRILPTLSGLMVHAYEAAARAGSVQRQGCLRAPALPIWLRKAGLTAIRRRTTLIERAAPLDHAVRQQWGAFLTLWSGLATGLDLATDERTFWTSLRDPDRLDRLLDDADFYGCEGNILAVGQLPDDGTAYRQTCPRH